jgi:hypothetical protein
VSYLVLALSSALFLCSCVGCLGAIRQTLRKGCLSGRRLLFMHQILLCVVLLFSFKQYEWINKQGMSMELVISNQTAYQYDGFERRLNQYFNEAYFDSLCEEDASAMWLFNFVDSKCPERMSREYCLMSETRKKTCDTSCSLVTDDNAFADFNLERCCPSEDLCNDGHIVSCPYHRCRIAILEELYFWTG